MGTARSFGVSLPPPSLLLAPANLFFLLYSRHVSRLTPDTVDFQLISVDTRAWRQRYAPAGMQIELENIHPSLAIFIDCYIFFSLAIFLCSSLSAIFFFFRLFHC